MKQRNCFSKLLLWLCLAFGFFNLIISQAQTSRWDSVSLLDGTGAGTPGDWLDSACCPNHSWVKGFEIISEITSFFGEDLSAVYALKLQCFDHATLQTTEIITNNYNTGSPQGQKSCTENFNFVTSFKIKVGSGDEGIRTVEMQCADGTNLVSDAGLGNGVYQQAKVCEAGTALCGLRVFYDSNTLVSVGVKNLVGICCRLCDESNGRFVDKVSKECRECDISCKTCRGSTSSECTSCFPWASLNAGVCESSSCE